MSRVTEDTINKVTELLMKGHCLSSPASQKNLSDVIDSICRELTEGCSAGTCRHLTEKTFDSHALTTDSLLLTLNTLVSVLSPANCRSVQNVQRRVVENSELFKALVVLLGCPNQLVSYSACKAMSYFLSSAKASSEKLDYIFKFSRHGNEDFKQDTNPETHYYQTLATFDLIRILCKQLDFQKSSQPNTSVCTCGHKEMAPIAPFKENCLENVQPLSSFVEYFMTVFQTHFGSDQKKVTICRVNFEREPDYGEVQKMFMPDWFEMLDCGEKDVLFISYLKMTKTLLKRDKIDIVSIHRVMILCNETLNVGTKLQRTSAKLIFDIVTDFLQKPVKIDMNRFQAETARNICSVFKADIFWENIPYHEGVLGFGGTEFTEKSEDHKGDLTLLIRKLAKLYFVALKILFDCKTEDRTAYFELVITSFSSLSKYISCKVGLDPTQISTRSESEWLCRLFADGDDDAMVFILLTVLQIYIRLTELLNQDSNLQKLLNSSNVMVMLCPHQLFWNYLKTFDFDHSLLLDLLISSETDFLQYFTSYLHCMRLEWERCGAVFRKLEAEERDLEERCLESDSEVEEHISKRMRVETGCTECVDSSFKKRQNAELNDINAIQVKHCDEQMSMVVMNGPEVKEEKATLDRSSNETKDNDKGINPGLDQVLSVMIRLRMSLERLQQKKMFPYTISPLIRLLVEIEELYEK